MRTAESRLRLLWLEQIYAPPLEIPTEKEIPPSIILNRFEVGSSRRIQPKHKHSSESHSRARSETASKFAELRGPSVAGINEQGPSDGAELHSADGKVKAKSMQQRKTQLGIGQQKLVSPQRSPSVPS